MTGSSQTYLIPLRISPRLRFRPVSYSVSAFPLRRIHVVLRRRARTQNAIYGPFPGSGVFREPERRCNGGVAILRAAGASFGRAGPGNCYSGPTPVPGLRPCYLDAHRRGADGPAGRRGHPPHPVRLRTPDMRRGRAPAGGHHSRCGPGPCTPAFAQARVIPWCCLFPQSAVSGAVPVFVLSRDLRPRGSVRGSPGSLAGVKRRSGPSGGRRGLELRCGPRHPASIPLLVPYGPRRRPWTCGRSGSTP